MKRNNCWVKIWRMAFYSPNLLPCMHGKIKLWQGKNWRIWRSYSPKFPPAKYFPFFPSQISHVWYFVCMHACMYVCMYLYMCVYTIKHCIIVSQEELRKVMSDSLSTAHVEVYTVYIRVCIECMQTVRDGIDVHAFTIRCTSS